MWLWVYQGIKNPGGDEDKLFNIGYKIESSNKTQEKNHRG